MEEEETEEAPFFLRIPKKKKKLSESEEEELPGLEESPFFTKRRPPGKKLPGFLSPITTTTTPTPGTTLVPLGSFETPPSEPLQTPRTEPIQESLILIPVPHATCDDPLDPRHPCDTFAKPAALIIDSMLKQIREETREIQETARETRKEGIPEESEIRRYWRAHSFEYKVDIWMGDLDRIRECDLNRKKCRGTHWRIGLDSTMSQFKKRPEDILVMGVHSFPVGQLWNVRRPAGKPTVGKPDWSGDVGVMVIKDLEKPYTSSKLGERDNFASFGRFLVEQLNRSPIVDATLIPGSKRNDILFFANELEFKKAVILEFNEDLANNPDKFDEIARIIALSAISELREYWPDIKDMPR